MTHNYKIALLSTFVFGALYNSSFAQVVTDGSVGDQVDIKAENNTYEIPETLGQTRGNNLFHSFEQFSVENGYIANFSGPAYIQNIISRVTGQYASHIDGTLQSSIQGANLYLLNPNGVLFGANASVNITGSFYVSTADYVKLGEKDYFYADTAKQSTFVAAEPSAFGFLSNAPAKIEASGSRLAVIEGKTLSLTGGDITLDGAQLIAVNGSINISSVASSGEVSTSAADMDTAQFDHLGDINLVNAANLDTSGGSGGHIVIRGGNLTLDNANIAANTNTDSKGSATTGTEPGVDIALSKDLVADNSSHITTNVMAGASENSSGISVTAANATVNNNSSVESTTEKSSTGAGGNITLDIAGHLGLSNQSRLSTQAAGSVKSADISVTANTLDISSASYISTSVVTSIRPFVLINNSAGDIHINADTINMTGLDNPGFSINNQNLDFTGISADGGYRGGSSGAIEIKTREMNLYKNAYIHSLTNGPGDGGDITVSAPGGHLAMYDGAAIFTGSKNTASIGGDIIINTDSVLVSGASLANGRNTRIATSAQGGSTGGDVRITGKSIRVENGGKISADYIIGDLNPKSGSVVLTADLITITGLNEAIRDYWLALGDTEAGAIQSARSTVSVYNTASAAPNPEHIAGNVEINAKDFYLTDQAALRSDNFGQTFPGNININASNKAVFDHSVLTTNSSYGVGIGGDINIRSGIAVFNGSTVETTAVEGVGGDITVSAKSILATPDSVFNASSQFSVAGNITFNSNVDIEKSVEALPSTATDAAEKFSEDCTTRPDKYSRLKTPSTYSSINGIGNLLSSSYALDRSLTHANATAGVYNLNHKESTNNKNEVDSQLYGFMAANVDCS